MAAPVHAPNTPERRQELKDRRDALEKQILHHWRHTPQVRDYGFFLAPHPTAATVAEGMRYRADLRAHWDRGDLLTTQYQQLTAEWHKLHRLALRVHNPD